MNSDIRIATGYPDHPKTRKLLKRLGAEGIKAHIFLLCKVGNIRPKGILHGFDEDVIEDTAQWAGESGAFVKALLEFELLEVEDGVYKIHNWEERQPYACGADDRSQRARNAASVKWSKYRKAVANGEDPPPPTGRRKKKAAPAPKKKAAKKAAETKPPDDPPADAGAGQLVVVDEGAKAPAKMGDQESKKPADQVLNGWNRMAKRKGLKPARRLSPGRRANINNKLKDKEWDWQGAINHLEKILPDKEKVESGEVNATFLQGGGPAFKEDGRSWVADFDFFIRANSVDKILEGKYDPQPAELRVIQGGASKRNQQMMDEHRTGTDWAKRKEAALRGKPAGDS